MDIRELSIAGSYEITPKQFADDRGVFLETYRFDALKDVLGHALDVRQVNTSVSRKGVLRGIHFAAVPRGQAKYVTVSSGAIIDYCIDIRVGSPTFGTWDAVVLDDVARRAVYVPEGLGHAFLALTDNATVTYLVSDVYRPGHEHGVNPFDERIGLTFDLPRDLITLSEKDSLAPSLSEAEELGLLPKYDVCVEWYSQLNEEA